ncbi:hypothetical protein, partial [Vallitalea sp.]|uniref:hypothetical protein n=1 Tax=Vallitalea sp. TaxID=1882829 RepID=UPI0025F92326
PKGDIWGTVKSNADFALEVNDKIPDDLLSVVKPITYTAAAFYGLNTLGVFLEGVSIYGFRMASGLAANGMLREMIADYNSTLGATDADEQFILNALNSTDKDEELLEGTVNANKVFSKNIADPMRDFAGSGIDSNPNEWNAIVKQLRDDGVEVIYRDGAMAYSPGLSPGEPGQLIIDPNASYSALVHEYQHYLDDLAGGFQGMRQLYDQNGRIIKELKAYMQEIKMADEMGLKDITTQLWENYRQERFKILGK